MKADILRKKYLDFFRAKQHKVVESDSLVPKDDPTVLFTPAGMNQFKQQFLGMVTDFRRAASSQRCLRTDDLDKVGKTECHHTFFEMLGNFSFGDYFKAEAISYAWEFLTVELKINPDRLWVSVYQDDIEAYDIWKNQVKFPAEKIVKLGDKDNFWPSEAKEKGPNGPCGPCSEIFYDLGKDVGCGEPVCDPSCSCGRFVEIWNLVFTQFNRKEGGILEPLPQKNIDTGMGLERITAVMQGVTNNFQTDLFVLLTQEIIGAANNYTPEKLTEVYAIADHLRAVVFSIFDGILPSNEGRGYVIRKLIRKSVSHLQSIGIKKPFLYGLIPVLAQVMADPYPELEKRRENISEVILAEEKSFLNVLSSSDALLKDKFSGLFDHPDPVKAGAIAFQVYDTHGIPFAVTSEWLAKHKITVSSQAFEEEMELQKKRSKLLSQMKGDVFSVKEAQYQDLPKTVFLGYENNETPAKVLRLVMNNQVPDYKLATIVLDRTVFYPESGGQVFDQGQIKSGENVFEVLDVKKVNNVIVHAGMIKHGTFKEADAVSAELNINYRLAIARNHTATHLLQAALRKVLGEHVQQQGSLVDSQRLRFDFTHSRDVTDEEIERIEETVNGWVIANFSVSKVEMSLEQAKKAGALAFFAEKYEDQVRVVSVENVSKEFCGGTHLDATGQIGYFKILQEGSVASGVRRIEAACGRNAFKIIREEEDLIDDLSSALKVNKDRLLGEVQKRLEKIKELEKSLSFQKIESMKSLVDGWVNSAEQANGMKLIMQQIDGLDMNLLRSTMDLIKQKTDNAIIALGSNLDGKAMLVLGVTLELVKKGMDSSKLVAAIAAEIGGSGGGRKDFAQAGGSKPENFSSAFEALRKVIGDMK